MSDLRGTPEEVHRRGSRIEEDDAIEHEADRVPEGVKDGRLSESAAHPPFGIGTAIEPKNNHCYHSTGTSCMRTLAESAPRVHF